MTTFEIESMANRGDIARDMNVGAILRYQILPEFLEDVRNCAWRKKWATISTVAGTRDYALAADFGSMQKVERVDYGELYYIGDQEKKVFAAEEATEQNAPYAYYLGRDPDSSGGAFKHLFLDRPPDAVYTLRYNYLYTIPFTDNVTPVDLAAWIPDQFHWAFVEGLKREIYEERFGLGDARAAKASESFAEWKQRAMSNHELTLHGKYRSIR
jgi:hypothetical protein